MLNNLANRVRELRYTKGWGPDDLADRAKISRTALYHMESGRTERPQAATLRRLARALGVEPEDLLQECASTGESDRAAELSVPSNPFKEGPETSLALALLHFNRLLESPPDAVSPQPIRSASLEPAVDPAHQIAPEVALQAVEKFIILLSSPLAKGIVKLVEESFRLLPILPALSGRFEATSPLLAETGAQSHEELARGHAGQRRK